MDPRLAIATEGGELSPLDSYTRGFGLVEDRSEDQRRFQVLARLEEFVQTWTMERYNKQHGSDDPASFARILTYGSQLLGVNAPGADIDSLIVFPSFVVREDVFSDFAEALRKDISADKDAFCESINENVYVPIIKTKFRGVEFDLIVAILNVDRLPVEQRSLTSMIQQDSVLFNMDDFSIRSLNGVRVNRDIEAIIKEPYTGEDREAAMEQFRIALRAVRHWARQRGIYGNKYGYLGGVNLAILVTYVIQRTRSPSSILSAEDATISFFRLLAVWAWPTPILIKEIRPTGDQYSLHVWDTSDPHARADRMPILTPSYPAANSTFNVNNATLAVMEDEFTRAKVICDKIRTGQVGTDGWEELFEPFDLFGRFNSYLILTATTATPDNLKKWTGFLESRLRFLVNSMAYHHGYAMKTIRIYPKAFVDEGDEIPHSVYVIGLRTQVPQGEVVTRLDLGSTLREFAIGDAKGIDKFNMRTPDMDLRWVMRGKRDLPQFLKSAL